MGPVHPNLDQDDVWDTGGESKWFDDMIREIDRKQQLPPILWDTEQVGQIKTYKYRRKKDGFFRRFRKMSKSEFSIPLIPLLIAGYFIFGGDDDEDTTEVNSVVDEKPAITEQVKEVANDTAFKKVWRVNRVIQEAKNQFLEDTKEETETVVVKDNSSDPYAQDDDRYEPIDNKW